MGKKLHTEILIRPIVTEKSIKLVEEQNQYCFEVAKGVSKKDVKQAIEKKFKVKVEKVRILNLIGRRTVWGRKRITGRRVDMKKAIVTLKSSDSIDLFKVK